MLARPFTRPDPTASTTRPRTFVPFERTVLPAITTGSVRLAKNVSPAELLFELTPSIRATRIRVPAGTVTFGAGFNLSRIPLGFSSGAVESALVSEGLPHAATLAIRIPRVNV